MSDAPSTAEITSQNLRVLIADENRDALTRLEQALTNLGHKTVAFAVCASDAVDLIAEHDPQLAIVMVHHDDEHALELIAESTTYTSGPVIVHVPGGDPDVVARAADRGVTAHLSSTAADDVQSVIEVALRRHREKERLTDQLQQLKTALERRTVIERAKGILMERHGVIEREAFELLRSAARSGNKRVLDVATAVCSSHALLPNQNSKND